VDELTKRKESFRALLENEDKVCSRGARRSEIYLKGCFVLSMIFGGLTVGAGILSSASMPIPAWLISVFAAIGTGATVVAREGQFRAKANWFYSVRDTAKDIIWKLDYELPDPATLEDVGKLSADWRRRRIECGMRMEAITTRRDTEKKS
jgi:hypothetical protein